MTRVCSDSRRTYLWRRPVPALVLIYIGLGCPLASSLTPGSTSASRDIGAGGQSRDQSPSAAFYLLPTRAWQLAAGGLLAVGVGAFDGAPRLMLAGGRVVLGLAAWVGLGLITGSALVLDSGVAYPGLIAIVPTGAAVLLIAGGGQRWGPGALLRTLPFRAPCATTQGHERAAAMLPAGAPRVYSGSWRAEALAPL